MIDDHHVWLTWAVAFLVPWAALWFAFPAHRRAMLWASVFTTPFGLTEPLFVPEYWAPPSPFDLAERTGFDIESLIFCFGIGGVGAVLYSVLTGARLDEIPDAERRVPLLRHHYKALAAPFVVFPVLYFLPVNPIYPGIAAMLLGSVATVLCRPDLKSKTWVGGAVFTLYYAVFVLGLAWLSPGYVERVWNLDALSGVVVGPFPLEELAFAFAFGLYWSGIYDHFTWRRPVSSGLGSHLHGMASQAWRTHGVRCLAGSGEDGLPADVAANGTGTQPLLPSRSKTGTGRCARNAAPARVDTVSSA